MSNSQHTQNASPLTTLAGVKAVYFVGIGGIGMSALARYFHSKGIRVAGYDKTETVLTKELVTEGIAIHYNDDIAAIDKEADLIIYTPAVPNEHKELNYFKEHNYKVVKRSDVLQAISSDSFNICIAGTHGKTTITTMVAHILRHSGYGCNAFLGGISSNYNTNFWSSTNNVSVIEADEYDRSFLKLSPDIAIITAMDADHLDIYGDEKTMQDAYVAFGNAVKEGGLLITRFGLKRMKGVTVANKLTYSLGNESANVFASNIQIEEGGYNFNVHLPDTIIEWIEFKIGGMHNVENMIAAIAVAHQLEIEPGKIKGAVADFKGVKRRFEYIIPPVKQTTGSYVYPVFIDDYAHHPEELKALLKSARTLFPQRKVTVIFQPHLFTRTKDFAAEFSESLSLADSIVLLPIYPAREQPVEGVTSKLILDGIDKEEKKLVAKEDLIKWAANYVKRMDKEFGEVIITAGAGDIDALVQPLKQIIQQA